MALTAPLRLALAGALGCWLVLVPAGPAGAADAAGWRWPLEPRPAVLAGFVAPAGPYAPGHRGVDLAAAPAAVARAGGAGTVAFAGRVAGRGVVSVDHPGGLRTTYEPVRAAVARGDAVRAGQPLGLVEGIGSHCAPGSCLHWGLRRGSTYLDPLSLLGAVRVRLLPVWSAGPAVRTVVPGPVTARPEPSSPAGPDGGADRRPVEDDRGSRALAGAGAAVGLLAVGGLARRRAPP